jgi:hypothetical protein
VLLPNLDKKTNEIIDFGGTKLYEFCDQPVTTMLKGYDILEVFGPYLGTG